MENVKDVRVSLPEGWEGKIAPLLEPGERLLAWFESDLDPKLHYARGLLLLTDQRLLGTGGEQVNRSTPADSEWQAWEFQPETELQVGIHAGVGTLDLVSREGRVAHWRFTAGQNPAAHRFAQRFNALSAGHSAEGHEAFLDSVCPTCGAIITSEDGVCEACTPGIAPPAMSSLVRLVGFAKPHLKALSIGFLLTTASSAAGLVPIYLTMPLMDKVLIPYQEGKPVDAGLVKWYLIGLGGASILAWILDWTRTYVLAWVSERISADLRNRTYSHLQRLSLEFFGGKRTGDLMSRLGSDTDRICNFLAVNLFNFGADVLMILMAAGILFWSHSLLALITLAPFPIIMWQVHFVRGRLRRGFQRSSVAWGEMTSVLADTIPGIRVVKAFAQEQREIDRFGHSNNRVLEANDRVNVVWSFFGPLMTLLTDLGLLCVWCCGVWLVFRHQVTVGLLSFFLGAMARFYVRVESMILMVPATQRAAASAHRLFEILDRVPSVPEPVKPVHPGRVEGNIELRELRFKYGVREVLHGLNLSIRSGEMIGLVGPSGAGKSTLINLICRFYDVAQGAILVDGVDIRSYPVEEYRRNIGIVLQEPFLFYGTVAENIAYGRPDTPRAEIVAAARAARAHEFILRLPDGYDSLVGERGQSLSGGERQRISIARALLIDPRILILDEATSSVDTETEREIQAALDNLIKGRTTIAIAHRLSTLRKADRLVVMERGRITEIGKHAELLETPGTYARLHHAQTLLTQEVGA